jgi:hypothetical protein
MSHPYNISALIAVSSCTKINLRHNRAVSLKGLRRWLVLACKLTSLSQVPLKEEPRGPPITAFNAKIWRSSAHFGGVARRPASAPALFQVTIVTTAAALACNQRINVCRRRSYVSLKIRYNFTWFATHARALERAAGGRLTSLKGLGRVIAIREHIQRACKM